MHGLAVVARMGLDITLIKRAALIQVNDNFWPVLVRFSRAGVTVSTLIMLAGLAWLCFYGAEYGLRAQILPYFLTALPALVVTMLFVGFFKGRGLAAPAVMLETGGIAGFAAAIIFVTALLYGPQTLTQISLVYGVTCWIIFLIAAFAMLRFKAHLSTTEIPQPAPIFSRESRRLYLVSLAIFLSQPGALIIAGFVLSDLDMGYLRIAERFALVISFFLSAVDPVFAPRAARAVGNYPLIRRYFKAASLLSGLPALLLAVILIWHADYFLSFASADASNAKQLLYVLVAANLFNAFTGSASQFLLLTGQEYFVMIVTLVTFGLALILYLAAGFLGGAIGFVIAFSAVLVIKNGLLVWRLMTSS